MNVEQATLLNRRSRRLAKQITLLGAGFDVTQPKIPLSASILTYLPRPIKGDHWTRDISLYERFGKMLLRRPDFKNVFVLSSNPHFARYSKLSWDCLQTIDHHPTNTTFEVLKLNRKVSARVRSKKRQIRAEKNGLKRSLLRKQIEEAEEELKNPKYSD